MLVDVDDLYEGHDRMDLLMRLKDANPLFRITAFAVPALCSDEYIESLPDWVYPVPHGFLHGDPPSDGGECRDWTDGQMRDLIDFIEGESSPRWQRGFKGPGWIISDACYEVLRYEKWWLADNFHHDHRRPKGLRVHLEGEGEHSHHHVQNCCGNGLEESWPTLLERVTNASSFELVSEVVRPWIPTKVAA